jgi:hypothetical protein
MRHRSNDNVDTRVPTLEPVLPDTRTEIDSQLRGLAARRVLTRAEAMGIVESLVGVLDREGQRDDLVRPLFATLDAVAEHPLIDRTLIVDALLDLRLALEQGVDPCAVDLADEVLTDLATVETQRSSR